MQKLQSGRVVGIVLALLSVGGLSVWAAGDTPIVILDGSLTMQSAVSWNQFQGTGDQRKHPNGAGSVTSVVVTVNGKDQTVTFNHQQCTVDVTYASTDINVATDKNGKGLSVSPFSAFQNGSTSGVLVHKNQNAKISHVRVMKAGAKAFDADTSGGTQVVIHYQ